MQSEKRGVKIVPTLIIQGLKPSVVNQHSETRL